MNIVEYTKITNDLRARDAWLGLRSDKINQNGEMATADIMNKNVNMYIDVGAKVGDFSKKYDCKKIMFEPDSRNNKELKKYMRKGDKLYNVALSDYDGVETFYKFTKDSHYTDNHYLSNLDFEDPMKVARWYEETNVKIKYLDQYKIKGNKILLKIDTDGMEWQVINGARELVDDTKNIAIEFEYSWYWDGYNNRFYDAYRYLRSNEFVIFRITPCGWMRIDEYYKGMENIEYCNYIALKNVTITGNVYEIYDVFGINKNQFVAYEGIDVKWN